MSRMDTRSPGRNQTFSTGTCFLLAPGVKGDANTGPVKDGHEVYYYGFGISKAIAPGHNGVLLTSGRVISTPITVVLQETPHTEEFMQAAYTGKVLGKLTVLNLINTGATAVENFRWEIDNARIVGIRSNMKRETGGYTTDQNVSGVDSNSTGWSLEEDPNQLAMEQDPYFQKSDGDVVLMKLVGDAVTIIYSPYNEDGSQESGNVPAYFNFVQNTVEAPK